MIDIRESNGEPPLHDPVSGDIAARLERAVPAGEEVLIRVFSDLTTERNYGAQWVLVTPARILIVPEKGGNGLVDVPVGQIAAARCETLVGGGRLEIERIDAPTLHLPYSATLAAKFSEVARGIEQLRKGEPFLAGIASPTSGSFSVPSCGDISSTMACPSTA